MINKTVVIHQPDFMPYLGFFHRLLNADLYVVLDNVQFVNSNRGWHKRDKIKSLKGEAWITVSVKKPKLSTRICDVLIDTSTGWRNSHLNLIRENYKNAAFFNEILPYIEDLYSFQCEKLADFNIKSIDMLLILFDIAIDQVFASSLDVHGKSNELLVDILRKVGANIYLSGIGASDYYDPAPYEMAGIKVMWQNFKHPVYPQQFGEFIPYLSSIDLLFNCGIEESREILRGGGGGGGKKLFNFLFLI
ncbi:MAG: WbqC family protein [Bacteroidales bacterium]|jgi:hypothetical protein|nr:WbqC family protein [Bacteroidales bacterium]